MKNQQEKQSCPKFIPSCVGERLEPLIMYYYFKKHKEIEGKSDLVAFCCFVLLFSFNMRKT